MREARQRLEGPTTTMPARPFETPIGFADRLLSEPNPLAEALLRSIPELVEGSFPRDPSTSSGI
jgi:hypothetical protein